MYPELFEIPFIHATVKSYGLMMVVAFMVAVFIIRRLSRDITPDPQLITNAALYSLIAGVVGARLFYVIHYLDKFKTEPLSVFAIWKGGLELLGGVILAVAVIIFYTWYHKLPVRRYLDILAVGLMAALIFGRLGCFLNGCCFGKPTNSPLSVRFPYGSLAYRSQVQPDQGRNRLFPHMELPPGFFNFYYVDNTPTTILKPYEDLSKGQKEMLRKDDKHRSLPVHPAQLYSSAAGGLCAFLLYLFWRRSRRAEKAKNLTKIFTRPGCTFGFMFVLYGTTRFFLEFVRDDNPFEFGGLTISQNISIALIILGIVLMGIFQKMKASKPAAGRSSQGRPYLPG